MSSSSKRYDLAPEYEALRENLQQIRGSRGKITRSRSHSESSSSSARSNRLLSVTETGEPEESRALRENFGRKIIEVIQSKEFETYARHFHKEDYLESDNVEKVLSSIVLDLAASSSSKSDGSDTEEDSRVVEDLGKLFYDLTKSSEFEAYKRLASPSGSDIRSSESDVELKEFLEFGPYSDYQDWGKLGADLPTGEPTALVVNCTESFDSQQKYHNYLQEKEAQLRRVSGEPTTIDSQQKYQRYLREKEAQLRRVSGEPTTIDSQQKYQRYLREKEAQLRRVSGEPTTIDSQQKYQRYLQEKEAHLRRVASDQTDRTARNEDGPVLCRKDSKCSGDGRESRKQRRRPEKRPRRRPEEGSEERRPYHEHVQEERDLVMRVKLVAVVTQWVTLLACRYVGAKDT